MTNKEAWRKGYEHGFKGLNPRPDYPLVGLAGSYRLGYEAGYKRRREPRGPKQNPGFLRHALTKHKVAQARKRLQVEIVRVQNRIHELEQEVIEYRHSPIWRGDTRAKQWAAQASLKKQKLQAIEKKLVKGLQELPMINPRRNGIVETAAGLQALEYLGGKAKRTSLGRKPKFNPARITIKPYRRGETDGFMIFGTDAHEQKGVKIFVKKRATAEAIKRVLKDPNSSRSGGAIDQLIRQERTNPRTKGSRDVLGVWYAENPTKRKSSGKLFYVYAQVKPEFEGNKAPFLVASGIYRSKTSALADAKKTYRAQYNASYLPQLNWIVLNNRLRNPSVTALSEKFQGEADGSIEQMYAATGAPANLARAGKLVFLKVAGRTLRIPGALVSIAPNEKLWITGDHTPLFETKARFGQLLDVGEISHICYETAKTHVGNGRTYEYVHEFGEDGGKRPHLIIDHEGMPILRGGDYKIQAEGIVN